MKLTLAEVKPKARPRFNAKTKQAYHKPAYTTWLEAAAWILKAQTDGTLHGGPVSIDIELHRGGATITLEPVTNQRAINHMTTVSSRPARMVPPALLRTFFIRARYRVLPATRAASLTHDASGSDRWRAPLPR